MPMTTTAPSVPLLDLKAQYATIRDECRDAIDRWSAMFSARYGPLAVLQTLPKRIRKSAERALRNLA